MQISNNQLLIIGIYIIGYVVAYFTARKAELINTGEWNKYDRRLAHMYCLLSWAIVVLALTFIAKYYRNENKRKPRRW